MGTEPLNAVDRDEKQQRYNAYNSRRLLPFDIRANPLLFLFNQYIAV